MNALLQDLIVAAIVLAAVAWLVRRALRRRSKPTPFCGDCPGCAGAGAAAPPQGPRVTLVPLQGLGENHPQR